MDIFSVDGDGLEDDGTLYSLSSEFLEAAITLSNTFPTKTNYSMVIYYLLGHAAELMLKAYLYKKGRSIGELKGVGHNLEALLEFSKSTGQQLPFKTNCIEALALNYKTKKLEYRAKTRLQLPNREDLINECRQLQSAVFENIFELY
ncbi:MAG: hypothetical protein Q7T36_00720 [Fluviicoccus sp.]|uniref:hypothetical protein n=1 Tax=Fluviicoccus sp. TaxID=2003552 RepID=UPI00271BD11F|nr:hypothetical protein [Fluviicoccus sp.]MDO8328976.1 hypothetical protein [Fluviicoccus sp.]